MITAWTKHLKDEPTKEQFRKSVMHSRWILDHLKTLLDEMENDLDKADQSPKTYESPNWDYRQAHNNGAKQYLRLIKKLITIPDPKETNERPIPATDSGPRAAN